MYNRRLLKFKYNWRKRLIACLFAVSIGAY